MILVPAYGRDYTSKAAVQEAWDSGKDFKIIDGPYINKAEYIKYGGPSMVQVRYAKQRKVMVIA